MALDVSAMAGNGDLLEVGPSQDVELVGALFPNSDEHADQVRVRGIRRASDNLPLTIKPNVSKDTGVKLPRPAFDRLDLNRLVPTACIGGDNVVMWHIAREGRGNEPPSANLGRHEVFANLLRKLIIATRRHGSPLYVERLK